MTSRIVSGPGSSPVSEWTFGIANTIVTVRRLSRAVDSVSEAPQMVQKRIRSGDCSPQLGQIRIPGVASGTISSPSPARSRTDTSRNPLNSSSEPFGLTGGRASNSTASPTSSRVDSWTRTSCGGEFCSMTVEISTGSPRSTCWPPRPPRT